MKILTNKEQIELMVKIKKLNTLLVNSNIDLKAFDLLGDIGTSVLDIKHLSAFEAMLMEELENEKNN